MIYILFFFTIFYLTIFRLHVHEYFASIYVCAPYVSLLPEEAKGQHLNSLELQVLTVSHYEVARNQTEFSVNQPVL